MVFTKVKRDAKYVFDAYLINSAEDGSVHRILIFKPVYKLDTRSLAPVVRAPITIRSGF